MRQLFNAAVLQYRSQLYHQIRWGNGWGAWFKAHSLQAHSLQAHSFKARAERGRLANARGNH